MTVAHLRPVSLGSGYDARQRPAPVATQPKSCSLSPAMTQLAPRPGALSMIEALKTWIDRRDYPECPDQKAVRGRDWPRAM